MPIQPTPASGNRHLGPLPPAYSHETPHSTPPTNNPPRSIRATLQQLVSNVKQKKLDHKLRQKAKNPYTSPQKIADLVYVGAGVNTESKNGNTALHHASFSGNPRVIRYLLGQGADVTARNNWNWTPLHAAAAAGRANAIHMLLEAGANPTARTNSKNTPEMLAIHSGHILAANVLRGDLPSYAPQDLLLSSPDTV